MRFRQFGWAIGVGVLVMMGCDDGGPSARTKDCQTFCEALEKCDEDTDLMGCQDKCEAEDFRSDDYLDARASCAEQLSCNVFRGEFSPQGQSKCEKDCAVASCVEDALADVELSDDQKSSCESISTKLDACDSSLDSGEVARKCQKVLPGLSEEYVTKSKMCIDSACASIEDCLDENASHYHTDIKLYSGPLKTD